MTERNCPFRYFRLSIDAGGGWVEPVYAFTGPLMADVYTGPMVVAAPLLMVIICAPEYPK